MVWAGLLSVWSRTLNQEFVRVLDGENCQPTKFSPNAKLNYLGKYARDSSRAVLLYTVATVAYIWDLDDARYFLIIN